MAAPCIREGCGRGGGGRLAFPQDGVNEGGWGQGYLHDRGWVSRTGLLHPGAPRRAGGLLLDAYQGAAGQWPAHGEYTRQSLPLWAPLLPTVGRMTWPPPLVHASAWGGQGTAGGQFGDVRDDGSGAGNGIWGVEAGAAVGRGRSLPSKGGDLCGRSCSSACPAPASPAAPCAHRVGARAMDVLQGVLPAVLGHGMCRTAVVQHQGAKGGEAGSAASPGPRPPRTQPRGDRVARGPVLRNRHPPRLTFSSSPPGSGSTAPVR